MGNQVRTVNMSIVSFFFNIDYSVVYGKFVSQDVIQAEFYYNVLRHLWKVQPNLSNLYQSNHPSLPALLSRFGSP